MLACVYSGACVHTTQAHRGLKFMSYIFLDHSPLLEDAKSPREEAVHTDSYNPLFFTTPDWLCQASLHVYMD